MHKLIEGIYCEMVSLHGRTVDIQSLFHSRNCSSLSFYNRLRIASNWKSGRYKETISFPRKKLFFTKTHLEADKFYITSGGYLRIYDRTSREPDSIDKSEYTEINSKNSRSDISNFAKKNEELFIGQVCGNAILYDCEGYLQTEQKLHDINEYLTCVDFQDNIYVTGSDRKFKIWKKEVEFEELVSLDLQHSFWKYFMCAKISGGKVFGGLYADLQDRLALKEIDLESGAVDSLNSNSFSIYDLKVKDDNILYTGHFDTTTRVFDRRTDSDEIIFVDPFDSSAYCIEHDGNFALLCGTKHHSRVNMYDIRVPNRVTQIYYPGKTKRKDSSPVYSLCCDSRYLFIATDVNLRVFDFKADWAEVKDYSNIISKW